MDPCNAFNLRADVVKAIVNRVQGEVGTHLSPAACELLEKVQRKSRQYGAGHKVLSTSHVLGHAMDEAVVESTRGVVKEGETEVKDGVKCERVQAADCQDDGAALSWRRGGTVHADEECEREVQREKEQEQERQVELAPVTACLENAWDFAAAIRCKGRGELERITGDLVSLRAAAATLAVGERTLDRLPWSPTVWCTRNFLCATNVSGFLNNHLRPVDAILWLPDGSLVMLSEQEADGIVQALNEASVPSTARARWSQHGQLPCLLHLAYLGHGWEKRLGSVPLARGAEADGATSLALSAVQANQIVSVKLFNGETRYKTHEEREVLREFVEAGREMVVELVSMRGKLPELPRSCLDDVCRGHRPKAAVKVPRSDDTCGGQPSKTPSKLTSLWNMTMAMMSVRTKKQAGS